MSADAAQRVREAADAIYRAESRRVFATLVRLLVVLLDAIVAPLTDGGRAQAVTMDATRCQQQQTPPERVLLTLGHLLPPAGETESCQAEAEKGEGTGFGHLLVSCPNDFHAKRG